MSNDQQGDSQITILASVVFTILQTKLNEAIQEMALYADDRYHKGAFDTAKNIMDAVTTAVYPPPIDPAT